MVTTAHECGVKVAVHTTSGPAAVRALLSLGVDSIEHAGEMGVRDDETVLTEFSRSKAIWVPTLAAYYTFMRVGRSDAQAAWERISKTFVKAVHEVGMENIACGGDTGTFAHGRNGLELVLMRRLGAGWEKVLKWATLGGWECVRGMEWEGEMGKARLRHVEAGESSGGLDREVPFGAVRKGWAADLVGIEGRIDGTPEEFEKAIMSGVIFVMKGGKVYKSDGNETTGP